MPFPDHVEQLRKRIALGQKRGNPIDLQEGLNLARYRIWSTLGSPDDGSDTPLLILGYAGGISGMFLALEPYLALSSIAGELLRFPALLTTWGAYMCLKPATRDFTNLQWDMLILEA